MLEEGSGRVEKCSWHGDRPCNNSDSNNNNNSSSSNMVAFFSPRPYQAIKQGDLRNDSPTSSSVSAASALSLLSRLARRELELVNSLSLLSANLGIIASRCGSSSSSGGGGGGGGRQINNSPGHRGPLVLPYPDVVTTSPRRDVRRVLPPDPLPLQLRQRSHQCPNQYQGHHQLRQSHHRQEQPQSHRLNHHQNHHHHLGRHQDQPQSHQHSENSVGSHHHRRRRPSDREGLPGSTGTQKVFFGVRLGRSSLYRHRGSTRRGKDGVGEDASPLSSSLLGSKG